MDTTQNVGAGAQPHVEGAGQAAEIKQQDSQATEGAGDQGDGGGQQAFTPEDFKKLQRQLAAQDRRIGRMTAAKYQTQRELQELRQWRAEREKEAATQKDARPQADQFQSYDEYNEAVARWAARQEGKPQNANEGAQQPNRVPQQETAWQQQMESQAIHQAQQLAQYIPDFAETWTDNGHFFDAMPYELEKALYQSQHPALAVYVLAKEGKLLDLLEMTPQQAAYEIGRATHVGVNNIKSWATAGKGQQQPGQTQQPTNAPQPLAPNKGAATGSRPLDQRTGKDVLAWMRS